MNARSSSGMHQIRFCTTSDGVTIAYAVAGAGLPLVKTPNWLNHLELDVQSLVWRSWIARMTERFRFYRYDGRGCGLSDRDVADTSFAAYRLDLEAVVDAARLKRFALFGASQGAGIAIEYAARHPERVSHLILYGPYLRGLLKRDSNPRCADEAQTMIKLVELGWGRENSAFRQVFANQFIPDSRPEQLRAFDEIQRHTASPETAARLLASFHEADVSALAPDLCCPTLVMHSRGDERVPFEEGRRVAAAIRGAEFVPLDSRNHILLEHQPAWRQFFDEIDAFLQRHPDATVHAPSGFADLTPSERRVLDLMAAARSNAQIASALGISSKTVRNHINHIFSKLGVSDRAQAIVLARESGFGRGPQ
ncbi:MAG TPA: alpha/beta fold hydrolase [Burkholderiaceae bacterium]|nr:alpha/beta fold hydrolase [Burkholderiaceae bacterium]